MATVRTTVAVITAGNESPVPSVARIAGLTTTTYAIVRNVVTPASASVRSDGLMASCYGELRADARRAKIAA